MATKTTKAVKPGVTRNADTVTLWTDKDQTPARRLAAAAVGGTLGNAVTVHLYATGTYGKSLDVGECFGAMRDSVAKMQGGDMKEAEALLTGQAAALNAMFGEMARRAAANMGQHLDATERYMRLALKAQGQCRMTVETLATIKNPPVVFARQANINNGGQQQVNNGAHAEAPRAHAANQSTEKTELLEASNGERLDPGTARETSRADPQLETLAEVHRPTHR